MKGIKLLVSCILLFVVNSGFCQSSQQTDTTKVIARKISNGGANTLNLSGFKVIKVLKGEVPKDTIWVYKSEIKMILPDTVLLEMVKTSNCQNSVGDSIFPCYSVAGIRNIHCINISLSSWSVPARYEEDSAWIPVDRDSLTERLIFFAPCFESGINISVIARGMNRPVQEISAGGRDCPAILEFTNLADGKYHIYVDTCGISRFINIHLRTRL